MSIDSDPKYYIPVYSYDHTRALGVFKTEKEARKATIDDIEKGLSIEIILSWDLDNSIHDFKTFRKFFMGDVEFDDLLYTIEIVSRNSKKIFDFSSCSDWNLHNLYYLLDALKDNRTGKIDQD